MFWKFASGEGASWTWNSSVNPNWRIGLVARFTSPGTGTSLPTDVDSGGTDNAAISFTAASITTGAANESVMDTMCNFQGVAWSRSSGTTTTQRVALGGLELWDFTQVSAGATGTTVYSAGTVDDAHERRAFKDNTVAGGLPPGAGPQFGMQTPLMDSMRPIWST